MSGTDEIHEARDHFSNVRRLPVDGDRLYRTGSRTPARPGAPSAADLLLKVLGDAHARLRSPSWTAHRVACIDAQIVELFRERARLIAEKAQ